MSKQRKLKGIQLPLPFPAEQGDRAILTVLCDASKLELMLEYARKHLGDRLVGQAVLVDLTIAGGSDADVELFRSLKAPVQMVVDWEVEDHA